MVGFESNTFG